MNSTHAFAEVDTVAKAFDVGLHPDSLSDFLTVGQIVSQVNLILLVHATRSDRDR